MKTRLLMLMALASIVLVFTPHMAQAAADQVGRSDPADAVVVVLVDQSGSLSNDDLREEVRAVGMLADVPNIRLHVIGFASKGTLPAWEPVCEPEQDTERCLRDLTLRTESEGNDTDFAAALAGAHFVLDRPGAEMPATRLVLLMTDGRYDPAGAGATGADYRRLARAGDRLEQVDAAVWPLGFGRAEQSDLNRLALGAADSCGEARGFIVDRPEDVVGTLNTIFAEATCNHGFDGEELTVSDGAPSVTLWFEEAELPDGEVTITNEAGHTQTFPCELDQLSGLWTCDIPTEEPGPGKWMVSPPPSLTPYVEPAPTPREPTPPSTTTTTTASSTTTEAPVLPPPPPVDPPPPNAEVAPAGFPWLLLLFVAALGAVGVAVSMLITRPRLPRGYIAVRAGEGEWSPEETVRRERRQAFAVDVDGRHPSIERTKSTSPDLALEANRRGISVAGRLVGSSPMKITLGDEVPLQEGITLKYVANLDDDHETFAGADLEDSLF